MVSEVCIGAYGDGYIGFLHASNSLTADSYTLRVLVTYRSWSDSSNVSMIPDGLYTIDFNASSATGPVSGYVGPIIVKTTSPVITGSVGDGVATGQITDKNIEYNTELARYGLDYNLYDKLTALYIIT